MMRKLHQQKILNILKTIEEAQKAHLYSECIAGAQYLCDFINKEKKDTKSTILLKSYIQNISVASESTADEESNNNLLISIMKCIETEIKPNKLEIVFLSYKASMSDCLESIYFAAKADPNCVAHWIPIPYFELSPTGQLQLEIFEDSRYYDKNIECIDWYRYDLKIHHPDVIFTFNPYDNTNRVTSVHPIYYCEKLRKYTDVLVYVPYFVTVNESIAEHFCTLPGCLFAHKVILESELIRNEYIKVYKNKIGDILGDPEEKFVAFGNPKFDKVVKTSRENCYSLRDNLNYVLKGKKVILYNTSLTTELFCNGQYLKKICHTIDIIKNKNGVLLWWRPHPLSESTYNSMNLEFAKEYKAIVDKYKNNSYVLDDCCKNDSYKKSNNNFIYDDSSDLHRAIACSDAYYGDMSSVVALYESTDKPIMIQDAWLRDIKFIPVILYVNNCDIWFMIKRLNALLKLNRESRQVECVGCFPNEDAISLCYNTSIYQEPCLVNNIFYFPAFQAHECAAYSVENRCFEKYIKLDKNESLDFIKAVYFEGSIFFIPFRHRGLIQLDIETRKVTEYSDWVNEVLSIREKQEEKYLLFYPLLNNENIWCPIAGTNAILNLNLNSKKSHIYNLGDTEFRPYGICFDGVNYWISPIVHSKMSVVKWNPSDGILEEFSGIYVDDTVDHGFNPIVYVEDFVWLLPIYSAHSFKINVKSNKLSLVDELEIICDFDKSEKPKFESVRIYGTTIIAYSTRLDTIIELDAKTMKLRDKVIVYPEDVLCKLKTILDTHKMYQDNSHSKNKGMVFSENELQSLENYVDFISNRNNDKEIVSKKENNRVDCSSNGARIYEYIRTLSLSR
jgi:hypothetical protein